MLLGHELAIVTLDAATLDHARRVERIIHGVPACAHRPPRSRIAPPQRQQLRVGLDPARIRRSGHGGGRPGLHSGSMAPTGFGRTLLRLARVGSVAILRVVDFRFTIQMRIPARKARSAGFQTGLMQALAWKGHE